MRKHLKKEILNLIKTLRDAKKEAKRLVKLQDYPGACEVLATCQEGAYSIGTAIEGAERDCREVIEELEAYCEDLYQLSVNLEKYGYDFDSAYRAISRRLDYVEDYVRNRIRTSFEIVFLPYKASMWDSMESVWKAASQDPDCICHVIPIPYYEKEAQQDRAVYRYEGDQFPGYVPVTSFKDYDLSVHKPDAIFFHNPYDGYNRVTSVLPEFYSQELRKHTKLLVYIPYYITGGGLPDSFRNIPAYKYIDFIVVQSKKAAKDYIDAGIPKNRILPLGSPKIDRVIYANRNREGIPEQWKPVIGGRKVVMYNTSISGFLTYNDRALKKMRHVISCFRGRKDAALLWRPHPLLKATIRSMRPQLLEQFCDIEREFLLMENGILDETPDIDQSIAISDAYIGEETSSVVHLFGVTGKPVFIINMDISEQDDDGESLTVCGVDAFVENGELWMSGCRFNALCRMNIDTGTVSIVGKIPGEAPFGERLYGDIVKVGDKVILAPHRAKELAVYDINSGSFDKVPLKNNYKMASRFARMLQYKDFVFLLPTYYPAFLRYNVKTGECKYYPELISQLKKRIPDKEGPMFTSAVCKVDNRFFAASAKANLVLEFNMDTGEYLIHTVGRQKDNFFRIQHDGKDFWLISNTGRAITRWNRERGEFITYEDFPEGLEGDSYCFLELLVFDDSIIVFPKMSNMILKIDKNTGKISEWDIHLPYKEGQRKSKRYNWPNNYYFAKKLDVDRIIAMTAYDNSLLVINVRNGEFKKVKGRVENASIQQLAGSGREGIPYAVYEDGANINDFIDAVAKGHPHDSEGQIRAYSQVFDNMDGTCGEKVYSRIIEELERRK